MKPKPPNNVDRIDAEVASIARRYAVEAIATLIACCRDQDASASAKSAAATKLLEFGVGRPAVVARQITTADVSAMSDDQRVDLLRLLVDHYFPDDGFQDALRRLYGDIVALPAPTTKTKTKKTKATPVPTNRFRRGPAKPPRPAYVPPDWGQGGYARPSPAPGGPPEGLKAVPASTIAANPEQGPSGAGQDGDHRLTPTPSNLPTLGLVEHLPPNGMSFDAFGNLVPDNRWRH